MLTYSFDKSKGPLYQQVYQAVKEDILKGKIRPEDKLPSKRNLAKNLGCSTITIENAYNQLMIEGFVYSKEKRGYYVAEGIPLMEQVRPLLHPTFHQVESLDDSISQTDSNNPSLRLGQAVDDGWSGKENGLNDISAPLIDFDFSSSRIETSHFPFSVMAKMIRETISKQKEDLLEVSPSGGVRALREAIAEHLASFRGMNVSPKQIIVGAGTEYLYRLIIQLLGREKVYCIENPGYKKLKKIYESNKVTCCLAGMDEKGIKIGDLRQNKADIAHINPAHHFPTGISTQIARRYELLAFANERPGRYIIEDDYDSEFRFTGKPLPTLQSIDASEKVIYLNTFSKSLTSTIRISYMVLPTHLVHRYERELGFYSCTVSTFEQYWLARFIQEGYFEKHINRMRLYYGRKRESILKKIQACFLEKQYELIENQAGLHFILKLRTSLGDEEVKSRLLEQGIGIHSLSDYDMKDSQKDTHCFLINYAGMDLDLLEKALIKLKELVDAHP
ncbi:PLP-dependent aminotransferase family protein [Atopobacter sp. AH10]|uniref:MocR-like pyridoxine biosynthesis transcription factor PdxR n=1 Tax=Atopobacter sp. AH10 TaxID=2315861 RepID=UPI000EF1AD76|nr:PLP-dependent aminotransferase family protein [Atopobacter sp. AH10]RLK63084.1 PLP-dependent aminotransferase family protein [Atopobacter sp. AH10]